MLDAHEPKVVNGPEIRNENVGESAANICKLFAEAEEEQKRILNILISKMQSFNLLLDDVNIKELAAATENYSGGGADQGPYVHCHATSTVEVDLERAKKLQFTRDDFIGFLNNDCLTIAS
ncbi:Vesicle-fusing ATPase [Channa argus]|uniref:Vesicle-fusing ATPase n=1 Tax=Channa argus TaxID=215402 RepID=A0A6G1QAW3_CHAAH|nr:Vesicle-fusing ATPase [Channa argus]